MGYDETEERILDAAARLLIRFGYDKTTLDDVAREAGLSRSTLYTRWKKKEALFRALIWREGLRYTDDFIARLENDPSAGTLPGFFRVSMVVLHESPFMMALYARERHILGTIFLHEGLTQMYIGRLSTTASFLTLMKQEGMIRADVDVPTLTYVLNSLQFGILKMGEMLPNEQSPPMDLVMEQTIDMINAYVTPQEVDEVAGHAALMNYLRTLREQLNAARDQFPSKG